ncbi:MAG: Cof-type HAD-IIB family hydrolase [Bacteroidales bacterium]|nr:Cof-type HAD-IIB family hydrolase [Bacteroidales bacterium]
MKALFFDIDGTLVSFKTHQIPESAVDAISRAHQAGNKIFISTGRPKAIITNLGALESRGLIDGYITMNGAYCLADGKVLYKSAIPEADARFISEYCESHGYPCIFVGEESMTIAGDSPLSRRIFAKDLNAPLIPRTFYDWPLRHPLFQITPFFTEKEQPDIEVGMPGCEFGRWHPAFVDITAKGNTKAHGIDILLSHFDIPLEDSVAFGDGGNDIPMLRHAGIGVAMGNASPQVKEAATMVTASVDDNGIADAIDLLMKNE